MKKDYAGRYQFYYPVNTSFKDKYDKKIIRFCDDLGLGSHKYIDLDIHVFETPGLAQYTPISI